MFLEEALWIRQAIEELPLQAGATVADIGSSDLFYRSRIQPHVNEHIYEPLKKRGTRVISCDSKAELGVDFVVDLCTDQHTLLDAVGRPFDLVICANMLEHVVNRKVAIQNLLSLVAPHKYLLLTVPHTYFRHEDPIDTMFRPTPSELFSLVAEQCTCEVVRQQIVIITDKQYYLMPVYPNKLLHNLPFFAYRQAWRWFLEPFRWKVSCVLLSIQGLRNTLESRLS